MKGEHDETLWQQERIGAAGFEPATSWSQTRRASQATLRPDSAPHYTYRPE